MDFYSNVGGMSGPPNHATNGAGVPLPLTVQAVDAQGDVAKSFTGTVSLALTGGASGASLLGTVSAAAVAGVVSFSDLRINVVGTGYVITASTSGLPSAATASFAIIPGPAQRLVFGPYPVFGVQAGLLDAVVVIARDAAGNVATGFTGQVELSLLKSPAGTTLLGTASVTAVAGVATFDHLTLTVAGDYQFSAASPGVIAAQGPPFPVTPGPATGLFFVSGSEQTGVQLTEWTADAKLRHPVYLGEILAGGGMMVQSLSLPSLAIFVIFVALQIQRSHYEEEILQRVFRSAKRQVTHKQFRTHDDLTKQIDCFFETVPDRRVSNHH